MSYTQLYKNVLVNNYGYFWLQSLKSRGIRFPDRYNYESKVPVSTPSSSVSAPVADLSLEYLIHHDTQPDISLAKIIQRENLVPSFTSQQTKEAFVVARNIIHLLSSVLHKDTLKVFYFAFLCYLTN
jgi:hypothetical protein